MLLRIELHSLALFDLDLSHTDGFVSHMTITDGIFGPQFDEALFEKLENRVEAARSGAKARPGCVPATTFAIRLSVNCSWVDIELLDGR